LDYYQQLNNGIKLIAVEGSRGCVKNCTFCDIKKIWGSYKFKNGHALADEIIKLLEQNHHLQIIQKQMLPRKYLMHFAIKDL
jgi:radical SAM superfamily enzyme YgiQ (UPF0313 family)